MAIFANSSATARQRQAEDQINADTEQVRRALPADYELMIRRTGHRRFRVNRLVPRLSPSIVKARRIAESWIAEVSDGRDGTPAVQLRNHSVYPAP